MRVAITYTEQWRRTVEYDIDDDDFAAWMIEGGSIDAPTAADVKEYLVSAVDDDAQWVHRTEPGTQDLDEFDYLEIDEVEIPTAGELP